MFKRDLEARQSLPTNRLTMRDNEQGFPHHPSGLSLLRRHSSIATSSSIKTARHDRNNSAVSCQLPVCQTADLSKRRPSLVSSRQKDRKDSTSSSSTENYSFVVLGVGGVGKTGNFLVLMFIYLR